jgi:hypothetical protein
MFSTLRSNIGGWIARNPVKSFAGAVGGTALGGAMISSYRRENRVKELVGHGYSPKDARDAVYGGKIAGLYPYKDYDFQRDAGRTTKQAREWIDNYMVYPQGVARPPRG